LDELAMATPWKFVDANGTFELAAPHHSSYLYFPLVNEAGMMSVVTPCLNGDVKAGQHAFLMPPVSVEDLHNNRSGRNFWVHIEGIGAWSAMGNSARQVAQNFGGQEDDAVILQAGLLWHKITRTSEKFGLSAELTSFVPASDDQVELMAVRITNISDHPIHYTPTAAIPIFGRSADNLRDHRHVTSLLQRIQSTDYGVEVYPTLSFDERGHQPNQKIYAVLGVQADHIPPKGFFPLVSDFIGEGGSLDWPEAVVSPNLVPVVSGPTFEGYEALGGLRFAEHDLSPGQSSTYLLMLAILDTGSNSKDLVQNYGTPEKFDHWLAKTKSFWQEKLENLVFQTGEPQFDLWLKWVGIQPSLRRMFGNSFLPYHDYGRGGRGWRDLWQDILSLLVMESGPIDAILYENFAGIRMDGSNATIIGSRPGEFKADRNNIPRVWMDHGAWPLLTTRLYIDQTGDLAFLLRDQTYFKDHLADRTRSRDSDWEPSQGTRQRTQAGEIYRGTVLEHLLVQHLTAFFNVGEHNQIRLEGGDWNDGMDMAAQQGESVAFSAMYASNLRQIGELANELQTLGHVSVELAAEMGILVDTLHDPVPYGSVEAKQQRLKAYFSSVSHTVSGKTIQVSLSDLAADCFAKADWLTAHIRQQEWIVNQEGRGWFNGYYDNDGQRLEGDHPTGVRMTLTGQVFPLMGGIATDAQAGEMIQSIDRYLFDVNVGGYRLNTNFKEVLLNMGRCFGFAYGHKENGAMFSHMAVMYAYALYQRGYAHEAQAVLELIYRHTTNFAVSRMYPGIPEYFDARGRGVYPYLTGSASWYLLTMLTQAFGVRGQMGNLLISPKLVRAQFDERGQASVRTQFAGRKLLITYHNPKKLDYGNYRIDRVSLNDLKPVAETMGEACLIQKRILTELKPGVLHQIDIWLASN
jgi:cellobiose phosphorylase